MTDDEKLAYVKAVIGIDDTSEDDKIAAYLALTEEAIINWRYYLVGRPENAVLEPQFNVTQIYACAAGYGQIGGSGELQHTENGIARVWKHADMESYVRASVPCFAKML